VSDPRGLRHFCATGAGDFSTEPLLARTGRFATAFAVAPACIDPAHALTPDANEAHRRSW
jgi:hypothetical protein